MLRPASSLSLALVALAAVAPRAAAQDAAAAGPTYAARIRSALDRSTSDRAAAMDGFLEATADDPSRPDAYCYIGELHRLNGDFTQALDNFQTCLNVSRTA